jgi:hypothetical protein
MTQEIIWENDRDPLSCSKQSTSDIIYSVKEQLAVLGWLNEFNRWSVGFADEVEQIIALSWETHTAITFYESLHPNTQKRITLFKKNNTSKT